MGTTITQVLRPIARYDSAYAYRGGDGLNCRSAGCWDLIDEYPTHDGNSTYIYILANGGYFTAKMSGPESTLGDVTSVTVYYVVRGDDSGTACKPYLQIGSTKYFGSEVSTSKSYTTFSYSFDTNPATGQPWSWSDLESLLAGIYVVSAEISLTQMYVIVSSYYPAGGAQAIIL